MGTGAAPTVAVLGMGLVGGSLFQLLHQRGHPVVGYDIDATTRGIAAQLADIGPASVAETIPEALNKADITVLAVPVGAVGQVLGQIDRFEYTGIITDVTSVKTPIGAMVRRSLPGGRWVGGHPMAGTQHSGFAAGSPTLLPGCAWVLCLDDDTDIADWLTVARWVTGLGCRVIPTGSGSHDAAVARISHIPHVIAAALATTAADAPGGSTALSMAAGSFRDATRVAATPPETVTAWLETNAEAVADGLTPIIDQLTRVRDTLRTDQRLPEEALGWLTRAHDIRREWPPTSGSTTRLAPTAAAISSLGAAGGWITGVGPDHLIGVLPQQGIGESSK